MPGYEPLHLLNLQDWVANAFGVDTLVAGFLTAIIIVIGFALPLFILSAWYGKDRDSLMPYYITVVGIMLMGFLTGIGWLPMYTWAIIGFYIAIQISGLIRSRF